MKLPDFAVRRPVSVVMIFSAILLLGVISLLNLDVDQFPEIEPPAISVLTYYPGASASDVESDVTKHIEDRLSIVNDLDKITSLSKDDLSVVTCRFDWGTDLDVATNDIRDKLDLAKPDLPDDAEEPVLFKFSSAIAPILFLSVSADESYNELYRIVDKRIADPLKMVPGVGTIITRGGLARQINVFIDRVRAEGLGLSVERIEQILARENINLPAGSIKMGRSDYKVRVPGRFAGVKEIEEVVVGEKEGTLVYLKDIAHVDDSFEEMTRKAWGDGRPGIILVIQKQSGTNTINVIRGIKKKLREIRPTLPSDVKVDTIIDSSESILNSIRNLRNTVFVGGILVSLVTFLFLRRLRTSIIVVLSIPLSLVISFVFLFAFNYTINLVSLMSLAVGIGMVVDNAIVVLENITRHVEDGEKPREAAVFGASEVGLAISASTLTTIVVFVPLIFVGGISGILFKELAFIVSVTLLASLFTSLTLTPMLTSRFIKPSGMEESKGKMASFYRRSEKAFRAVEAWYGRVLCWALVNRKKVVGAVIIVFILTLPLIRFIGTDFFPQMDMGEIRITAELSEQTRIEETCKLADKIMELFDKLVPEKNHCYAVVGQSKEGFATAVGFKEGANVVIAGIKLIPKEARDRSVQEIADFLRKEVEEIPGIERLSVSILGAVESAMLGGAKPVTIEILGHDIEQTDKLADEIKLIVEEVSGAVDVTISRKKPRPEVWVCVDRRKASSLGLNMVSITSTLRSLILGHEATVYRDAGDDFDIYVRLREEDRDQLSDVLEVPVASVTGELIRLGNVARIEQGFGPIEIERKNRERIVKVEADLYQRSLGKVVQDIKREIRKLAVPPGILISWGGDVDEQRKAFRDLTLLLVLGIVLVYMVMASQFESFLNPFIIMFSIPFAFTGVIWAFFLTGVTLSVTSFIGIILLMGIVVNNAIVLIDYINTLRARGLDVMEAVRKAGSARLRPVLMTTLTTVFGVLPMALSRGEGSEIWVPIGVAVIGGLLVSTFITLVLIPTLYSLFEQRLERFSR